jgi:hypothetical protein
MNTTITIAALIAAFLLGMWSYQKGFRDGLSVNKGKDITPIIRNPVTAIKTAVENAEVNKAQAEMEKLFNDGIANIFAYDGTSQKNQ